MGNKQSSDQNDNNADLMKQIYTDQDDESQTVENNKNTKYEFTVCSFNIWCPFWNDANGLESKSKHRWYKRHTDILRILAPSNHNNEMKQDENEKNMNINADIYGIQEFWCDNKEFVSLYENYFKPRNYGLHYLKRSAKHKPDGIAILINESIFKVMQKIDFEYKSSNRVAIMMQLQHIQSGLNINIGNTHFTFSNGYNSSSRTSLCNQFIDLMDKNISDKVSLTVLCGDYNCDINETECILCLNEGYQSSFHIANKQFNGKMVSHLTHKKQSVFADHIFFKRNKNVDKDNKFGIKVIDSYLYPSNVAINKWPNKNEWDLSDHRPLVTTFQMQQKS